MEALRYQRSVIQTGWIEGHANGKAEGLAEGMAKGEIKATKEMAQKMKKLGMPTNTIMSLTGLSEDDINKI